MLRAMEILYTADSEADASTVLALLGEQSDFLGGRILPPAPSKPAWRVQAFHDAEGVRDSDALPDGCRVVLIPPTQRARLGIR